MNWRELIQTEKKEIILKYINGYYINEIVYQTSLLACLIFVYSCTNARILFPFACVAASKLGKLGTLLHLLKFNCFNYWL